MSVKTTKLSSPNQEQSSSKLSHTSVHRRSKLQPPLQPTSIKERFFSSLSLVWTDVFHSDDVNVLLDRVKELEGFPTNPNEDIYGFDARVVLTTFEIQWDNGEDVEGDAPSNPTDENKQTFKDVLDSISSLARQKAK